MKIFAILAFVICGGHAFAEKNNKSFLFEGNKRDFIELPDKRILISKDCENLKCVSMEKLKIGSLKKAQKEIRDGANPGAYICDHQLGGKLITGTSEHGMISFCQFSDNSIIDTGTITFYANENDERPKKRAP